MEENITGLYNKPKYKKYKCKYFKICGNYVERINKPGKNGFTCYSCKVENDKNRSSLDLHGKDVSI